MKTIGEIKFKNNDSRLKTNILIDTGASHCFINPKIFSDSIRTNINQFKLDNSINSLDLKLFNGLIETINSSQKTCCIVVNLRIKIGRWRGLQEFIISDEIENEECILGRNFLKKNKVKIDYGCEKLTIGSSIDFESIYLLILENYFFFYLKYLFKKKLINVKRF